MKSVMTHNFSRVPKVRVPRSSFNRSHGYKTTFDVNNLIPIYADEALPGDTFNLKVSTFARLATPKTPFMDNMKLDIHFFAVPYRLIWDNWEKFMGDHEDPMDPLNLEYPAPLVASPASTGYSVGALSDYLGIPTGVPELSHSPLFHRAYALCYNEWYRDQNLCPEIVVHTDNGASETNVDTAYPIMKRAKRHDYFTSALPWPQKGIAATLSLGGMAPVMTSSSELVTGAQSPLAFNYTDGSAITTSNSLIHQGDKLSETGTTFGNAAGKQMYPDNLYADLSQSTPITINDLRETFQLQKLFEKDARGGTRYTEIIRSHFGVTSPDMRVQRPEFLGSATQNININAIAQTSETTAQSPQASLAAIGTSSGYNHGFTKSFTEHCIILGIASVRADLTYQQGLDKKFFRTLRTDYYWPSFAHLGEQVVENREIYAQGNTVKSIDGVEPDDYKAFGYQERYAEYRYFPSKITGKFRSSDPQSLDFWHLSETFGNLPTLSQQFIEENTPLDRVIAVTDEPHFIMDAYFDIKCARPMPVYSVPGLIDHF
jgi:hypothetical protein